MPVPDLAVWCGVTSIPADRPTDKMPVGPSSVRPPAGLPGGVAGMERAHGAQVLVGLARARQAGGPGVRQHQPAVIALEGAVPAGPRVDEVGDAAQYGNGCLPSDGLGPALRH